MGSHLEADCWVLHPKKKPKDFETPKKGKERGRGRDRTRSKSRESEDTRTKKKGRENSPHPSKTLGRVTDKPYGTDRDSDGSSDDKESLKDLEREMLQATERFEKKKANMARRISTGVEPKEGHQSEFLVP